MADDDDRVSGAMEREDKEPQPRPTKRPRTNGASVQSPCHLDLAAGVVPSVVDLCTELQPAASGARGGGSGEVRLCSKDAHVPAACTRSVEAGRRPSASGEFEHSVPATRAFACSSCDVHVVGDQALAREDATAVLPDDVLLRIFFLACRRGWTIPPPCSAPVVDANDTEPALEPCRLLRLRAVSQRFRRLAGEPCLWRRLSLWEPSCAALNALAAWAPEGALEAVRMLTLSKSMLDGAGVAAVASLFGPRLETLSVGFDNNAPFPFGALPQLASFPALASLRLAVSSRILERDPAPAAAREPATQLALAALADLPLRRLELTLPLEGPALAALARSPLARSLRALSAVVLLPRGEPPAAALAALAAFASLERLRVAFVEPATAATHWPHASAADLRPLAALTGLRALALGADAASIGFVRPLGRLEAASLNLDPAADCGPLAALAPSLRSLELWRDTPTEPARASLAAALPRLAGLEELRLHVMREELEALAARPLALPKLRLAQLDHFVFHRQLPACLFPRLAADLPALRHLILRAPLPLPEALPAVAALAGRPGLLLEIADEAAALLDAEARAALAAALPGVALLVHDEEPASLQQPAQAPPLRAPLDFP